MGSIIYASHLYFPVFLKYFSFMKLRYLTTVFLLLAVHFITEAQEKNHDTLKSHHGLKGSSRLTLGLWHTHISEGKVDGKTEWLTKPS
jgi:hypothetical protein